MTVTDPIAVTLSPTSASLALSGTQVLHRHDHRHHGNAALNWYVNGVLNGNAAQGTLTACTTVAPLTCKYTAPPIDVPSPNPAVIKVASDADPGKYKTAKVTVTDPIAVTLSPTSAESGAQRHASFHRHHYRHQRQRRAELVRQRRSEWQRGARYADRLHHHGAPDLYLHGAAH